MGTPYIAAAVWTHVKKKISLHFIPFTTSYNIAAAAVWTQKKEFDILPQFTSLGFEPAIWRQGREYKFGHRKYVSHFYLCSLLAFNSGSLAARSDTILRFHIFCIHQIIPRCQRINHYILLSKSGACTFHSMKR